MAEFASLDGQNQSIPTSGASTDRLQLTTPNSMITGTMAGLQQIGSPSLTIDSVKNLITVKPVSTANTQILRYGQVATGFLGMAVNDGTNDTMFAGQDNTGATVVKIAKTGFDAKTASAANLIFNSSQDVFKIVGTNTSTITVPDPFTSGTILTNTVAHNLSIKPAFMAFVDVPIGDGSTSLQGKLTILPALLLRGSAPIGAVTVRATADVDATNIYFRVENTGGFNMTGVGGNWTFKYYILQETAN